jgi:hypothetical protein
LIILDENILDCQRLLLGAWRLPVRQIGVDLGRKGMKDDEIVVLLRGKRNATFFTRDADFYSPSLRHSGHCIVVANVGQNETAAFIRRFLRHPDFDTRTKRMGRVVRISHASLAFWRSRSQTQMRTVWKQR